MKQIQDWMGHSDYQTTANIYAHLESESKQASLDSISKAVTFDYGQVAEKEMFATNPVGVESLPEI